MPELKKYATTEMWHLRLDLEYVRQIEQRLMLEDGELTALVANHPGRMALPRNRLAGYESFTPSTDQRDSATPAKRRKTNNQHTPRAGRRARNRLAPVSALRRRPALTSSSNQDSPSPAPQSETDQLREFGSSSGSLSPMSTSSIGDQMEQSLSSRQLDFRSEHQDRHSPNGLNMANSLLMAAEHERLPGEGRAMVVLRMGSAVCAPVRRAAVAVASRVERVDNGQGDKGVRVYRRMD
ncbi:hypothetical protein LTR15_012507 [Elasticomyces elasticus]|nr:hypothetical protein LTR15_012507 [Elasticomyces elasticus]